MRAVKKGWIGMAGLVGCLLAVWAGQAIQEKQIPAMKFNDVVEMAPGVFFRYSSISATDMSIPFGGCNNTWIVFKDFVVVIDANFPKEAEDVLAAIRKTTDKPIRFVLDTHHHGDHAYGNTVWAREGAKVVGHVNCSRLLATNGPRQWDEAAKDRKDIASNKLKTVDIAFDDSHVIDDGTQRVEFHHLGHAHTAGDAVALVFAAAERVFVKWIRVSEARQSLASIGSGDGALAPRPAEVRPVRRHVHLFAGALADIADEDFTRRRIHGKAERIAQADAEKLGHERVLTEWDSVLFGKLVHLRTICRDNWVCTAALDGTMNKAGEGELYDLANDPLQHVNRWSDDSVRSLRDDLLSDMWVSLPAQVLPLRTMDAPV